MRPLRLAAALGLLIAPATATAEDQSSSPIEEYVAPVQGWMESVRPDGISTLRQVLPSTGVAEAPGGPPLILYINKNGVTLAPGDNDARTNKSTLVTQTTAVPAWTVSATAWSQIMSCTQTMFAPFNITVTDVDPGATVSHMESVVTTLSSTIGMDPNVGGVSPYTIGCDYIPNSIVFTFAQAFNGDPETVCEVMAQEMAHSIGLDHQMLASDPMTYLDYTGLQSFKDQTVSCGEYQNRACGLQGECGATQNSYQMLMTRVGAAGGGGTDAIPTLGITAPANGAQVPLGFRIDVNAQDDGAIAKVDFKIDGTLVGTDTTAPFSFSTANTMAMGQHTVETIATDDTGQVATQSITVTITNDAPPQDPPDTGEDPDDPSDPNGDPAELVSGCSASTDAGGGMLLVLLGFGLVYKRRRAAHR